MSHPPTRLSLIQHKFPPQRKVEFESPLLSGSTVDNPSLNQSPSDNINSTKDYSPSKGYSGLEEVPLRDPSIDRTDSLDFRHRRSASLATTRGPATNISQPPPNDPPPTLGEVQADAPPPSKIRTFYENNKSLAYVLLAQVFGCLMNVTTRILEIQGNKGKGMHPFQILFVRMTITTTITTLYMWWAKIPHFPFGMPEVRWLLVLRGIGGFFGVFGMYYSLLYLPLADATVITFIAPSLSCFACAILLKEPYTRMEQMGALVSFLGVTLIARPTSLFHRGEAPPPGHGGDDGRVSQPKHGAHMVGVTSQQRVSAVLVALVGVVGQAMAFTTMRWIGKRAHPLLSVNYFCICCTIVSAIAMVLIPSVGFLLPQDGKEWSYLIFLGFCGFTMQFLLSAGLQASKSSRATNMVYTQMLFALIFDKLVFGTNPALLSLLGSGLILGSAIYVAMMKETMKAKQEAEKARAEEALASGRVIEMERRRRSHSIRDEERGLVQNVDEVDEDEKEEEHQNGHAVKPAN